MDSPVFAHAVSNIMSKKTKTKVRMPQRAAVPASKTEVANLRQQVAKLSTKASTPFASVGAHLGNMVGFKQLGKGVGGFIGKILGSGDYTTNFSDVQSNSMLTAPVPTFGGTSATIIHREYIQDVVTSSNAGGFSIQTFSLNPGIGSTFPWLSVIAQNYEEYDINGMVFEFKTMSGQSVASTNTALGSVILATQYDPTKPIFADKQEMENYDFAQSCKPSESVLHAVECKKTLTPVKNLYVRTGATSVTGPDLRWSDFGNFSIATVGMPGTSVNVGELWCSYSITLRKPRLPSTGISAQYQSHAYLTGGSTGSPLGSVFNYQNGPINLTITGGNSISFIGIPGQVYQINLSATNGNPFTATYTFGGLTGAAFKALYINDSSFGPTFIDTGLNRIGTSVTIQSTATIPNQLITIPVAAVGTGNQWQVDLWVIAIDGTIVR